MTSAFGISYIFLKKFFFFFETESAPKCYNASDPELNSTAWFAEYIGPFIEFITLQDFFTFGSPEVFPKQCFVSLLASVLSAVHEMDVQCHLCVSTMTASLLQVLQLFTVDRQNIAIFNQTVLPVNVVNYYTELLYKQDSNFNPIL